MIEEEPVTSAVATGAVVGAAGLSFTVTLTAFEVSVVSPSLTVQVNVYVPTAEGVNIGVALEALFKPVAGDQL